MLYDRIKKLTINPRNANRKMDAIYKYIDVLLPFYILFITLLLYQNIFKQFRIYYLFPRLAVSSQTQQLHFRLAALTQIRYFLSHKYWSAPQVSFVNINKSTTKDPRSILFTTYFAETAADVAVAIAIKFEQNIDSGTRPILKRDHFDSGSKPLEVPLPIVFYKLVSIVAFR